MSESNLLQRLITRAVDPISDHMAVIDTLHAEIHKGRVFSVFKKTNSLAPSSWIDIQFNNDSTINNVHIKDFYTHNSGGLYEVVVYESPSTFTPGTSEIESINRYRPSTKIDTVTIFGNPTFLVSSTATSTQATIIENYYSGSTGTAANDLGAYFNPSLELVLNAGTTYIFRLLNLSGNACYSSVKFTWYESTS